MKIIKIIKLLQILQAYVDSVGQKRLYITVKAYEAAAGVYNIDIKKSAGKKSHLANLDFSCGLVVLPLLLIKSTIYNCGIACSWLVSYRSFGRVYE